MVHKGCSCRWSGWNNCRGCGMCARGGKGSGGARDDVVSTGDGVVVV